jgi:hypothetical protein
MSPAVLTQAAQLAVLAAATLIGTPPADRITLGLLGFGVVNVLVRSPGTTWVRRCAVIAAAAGLAWPHGDLRTLIGVIGWLVWPPAFVVAWASGRERQGTTAAARAEDASAGRNARIAVAAMIGTVACASLAYRLVLAQGLEQTAALFVGLPALLAIGVVFFVSPRSAVGVACKAVTIGLLVSLLFLGEGLLCVVMSAPLFYAVAVFIALLSNQIRRERHTARSTLPCLLVLAVVPMSLEGVAERASLNRDEWISETRIVNAPAGAVGRAIVEPPRFDRALPWYLRAGFPRPTATRIETTDAGVRWVIRFRGGEMRIDGLEPRAGDLVLELQEARPGSLRWRVLGDDSHMTHFLQWQEARVAWEAVDARTTRVTWTLRYRRGLDPAWYFGPWERYAVRLAAGYLIDAVATP